MYQQQTKHHNSVLPLEVTLADGTQVQVRDLLQSLMHDVYLLSTEHQLIHISEARAVEEVPEASTDNKRRALRYWIQAYIDQIPEG